MSLITPAQVVLELAETERGAATAALAARVPADRVDDLDGFLSDVRRREDQMATGLPGGIAIPHSRSPHVLRPFLVFGRSRRGIEWGAADGPARLVFLIGVPEGGSSDQLAILARLARRLTNADFRDQLLTLGDPGTVCDLLDEEIVRS